MSTMKNENFTLAGIIYLISQVSLNMQKKLLLRE